MQRGEDSFCHSICSAGKQPHFSAWAPALAYSCVCVRARALAFPHLSVKVSIDHYLGLSSIHTNGLHYLLINTDGWR